MSCAPIIIPTLNRVDHLARLVDSLKNNPLSMNTDVYIGLDFPPSPQYEEGYNEMKIYLKGDFSFFRSFNVIRRSKNLGYLDNVDNLISIVLDRYDRFIYMDDDLEVSPNFLEYMNACLDAYEKNQDVIAVCGYSYPLEWNIGRGANCFQQSFVCPMWGTGFWREKYKNIKQYLTDNGGLARDVLLVIRNGGLKRMSNICKFEYTSLCLSPDYSTTLASRMTDISLRMYMSVHKKYSITPATSKVRNWGFDGTGEFCQAANLIDLNKAKCYPYHLQPIDEELSFVVHSDPTCDDRGNLKLLNTFDHVPSVLMIKAYLKLLIYIIIGRTRFIKFTLLLRKLR